MKKIFKKIMVIMAITVMLCPEILPFVELVKVNALEIELTGVSNDGGLYINPGEIKNITVNSGLTVTNCYIGDDSIATATLGGGGTYCEVSGNVRGLTALNITAYDGTNYHYKTVPIIVDMTGYMDAIKNKIQDIYYLTADEYRNFISDLAIKFPNDNIYSTDFAWEDISTVKISLNINHVESYNNISFSTAKDVCIVIRGIPLNSAYIKTKIGRTKKVELDTNHYAGNYGDLLFRSENPEIATVDQNGIVTGIAVGNTNIIIYDKLSQTFSKTEVEVFAPVVEDFDALKAKFTGNIDINISENILASEYNPEIDKYVPDKIQTIKNYFYKEFYKMYPNGFIYLVQPIACNENFSNCTLQAEGSSSGNVYDINTTFVPTFKGIAFTENYKFNKMRVGEEINFDDYIVKYSDISDNIVYTIDSDYLLLNEDGTFTIKKVGKTSVTIRTTNYSYTEDEFYFDPSFTDQQTFTDNFDNIDSLTLPYSAVEFNNNLDGLTLAIENSIKETLLNGIEYFDDFYESTISCLSTNVCAIKVQLKNGNHEISYSFDKNILINYTGVVSSGVDTIKTNLNTLKSEYNLSFEETILNRYKSTYNDELNYYNNLINEVVFDDFITTYGNSYEVRNITYNNLPNEVTGYVAFDIVGLIDGKAVSSKRITINTYPIYTNNLFNLSTTIEDKITALEEEILSFTGDLNLGDITVNHLGDDIYHVSFANSIRAFNLILDVEDQVSANQGEFSSRFNNLPLNTPTKLKMKFYPSNYTVASIIYRSSDPSIATVDEDGKVTILKRGYATIYAKVGYCEAATFVASDDITIEKLLNDEAKRIPTTAVLDYGSLQHEELENVLSNYINMNLTNTGENNWFNFQNEIICENDLCKARIFYWEYNENTYEMNSYYSDYKNITYTKKGIELGDIKVNVALNETKKIPIKFSEGNTSNLYYRIDNPTIASFDINGNIKGLKTGYTTIGIFDKYNKYSNYFTVYVDETTYIQNTINKLNVDTVTIDASNMYSLSDSSLADVFNWNFSNEIVYGIADYVSPQCSLNDLTCTLSFEYGNNQSFEKTYNIILTGIYIEKTDAIELDLHDSMDLNTQLTKYSLGNLTYTSLTPTVCTINNSTITGNVPGACFVEVKDTNNLSNYFEILVGRAEIIADYNTQLANLPEFVQLGMEHYLPNMDNIDMNYYDIYYNNVNESLEALVNKHFNENFIYFTFDMDSLVEEELEVSMGTDFRYDIYKTNGEYVYLSVNIEPDETNKTDIKVKFNETVFEKQAELDEIVNQINSYYTLNLKQVIAYQLDDSNNKSIWEYSSFYDLFEDSIFDVDFMARMGGGDEYSASEGGNYIISYNGKVISWGDVAFTIYYENNNVVQSQTEFIEQLKETVAEAYSEVNNSGLKLNKASYTFKRSNYVITPNVKVTYLGVSGSNEKYFVEVEDVSFALLVGTKTTGNETYEQYILGDLDLNGAISTTDLVKMRKYLAGISSLTGDNLIVADIDGNGSVTTTDLIRIRKHLAGIQIIA